MDLTPFTDRGLWDLLEDVAFWIKDRQGRFAWVNATLAAQAQAPRERIIGTLDSDWFFNELATVYMEDDIRVMERGKPLLHKPELVLSPQGAVRWYATSKFPHRDGAGRVIGTYGMSRPMEAVRPLPAEYADLSSIVNHAHGHIGRGVTVRSLARAAGMSLSTLERTVARHLRITPRDLLHRIRMQRARHLLVNSALKIGEISLACGYESFSSFSRAFRAAYGHPPGRLRTPVPPRDPAPPQPPDG